MVLVDTSVWIRFLANRAPYASELARLLHADEVAGHELVEGELLIGDRGARRKLLIDYERLHYAKSVPHNEVVGFAHHRHLHCRGVGWIDVHILASAFVDRLPVWTADPRFAALAHDLGIAYQISGPGSADESN